MIYAVVIPITLLVILVGWLIWKGRPEEIRQAYITLGKVEVARAVLEMKLGTVTIERDAAKLDASAQRIRADVAEGIAREYLAKKLDHLSGDALVAEINRLLQEAAGAPVRADGGDGAGTTPDVVRGTVVEPDWDSGRDPAGTPARPG